MHELNRNQRFLCCFVCQSGYFMAWDHDGWLYGYGRSSNRWGSSTSLTVNNNKKKWLKRDNEKKFKKSRIEVEWERK